MSEFGTCPRCGGTTMDYHCGPCLAEANARLRARVAAQHVLPELELLLAFCEFACYAGSPLLPLLPVPHKRDEILHAFLLAPSAAPRPQSLRAALLAFCQQFCANKVVMDERRWVQAMDETYYTAAVDAFLAQRNPALREFTPLDLSALPDPAGAQGCPMCGGTTATVGELCADCAQRSEHDDDQITQLMTAGHTYHCAARQTWGDGTCECGHETREPRVPGGL